MSDRGKKRKPADNNNSNVENITNAVANLRRRLGLTTTEALSMLAHDSAPGSSRQHRGALAARRLMNSQNMVQELAQRMDHRTLAAFAQTGKQQRDAARSQMEAEPAFFDRSAIRSRGRVATRANRLKLATMVPHVHPRRITHRIPSRKYAQVTRQGLLGGIEKFFLNTAFKGFRERLEESYLAAALENPHSALTRDLGSMVVFRRDPNIRYRFKDEMMTHLRKLGKQALFIIAVHTGIFHK